MSNGGLIALSVDECDLLIGWARTSEVWDMDPWGAPDEALLDRLSEWRERHVPEVPQ